MSQHPCACNHNWLLDCEVAMPRDALGMKQSIFLQCLKCGILYRDNEIVKIIKNYERVIYGFKLVDEEEWPRG
jgi:hypothetical protein